MILKYFTKLLTRIVDEIFQERVRSKWNLSLKLNCGDLWDTPCTLNRIIILLRFDLRDQCHRSPCNLSSWCGSQWKRTDDSRRDDRFAAVYPRSSPPLHSKSGATKIPLPVALDSRNSLVPLFSLPPSLSPRPSFSPVVVTMVPVRGQHESRSKRFIIYVSTGRLPVCRRRFRVSLF